MPGVRREPPLVEVWQHRRGGMDLRGWPPNRYAEVGADGFPSRYPMGAYDSMRSERAIFANLGGTAGVLLIKLLSLSLFGLGQKLFCYPVSPA